MANARSTFTETTAARWKPLLDALIVKLLANDRKTVIAPGTSLRSTHGGLLKPQTALSQISDALKYIIDKYDYMYETMPELFRNPIYDEQGQVKVDQYGKTLFEKEVKYPQEMYVKLRINLKVRLPKDNNGVEFIFKPVIDPNNTLQTVTEIKNELEIINDLSSWIGGTEIAFVRNDVYIPVEIQTRIKDLLSGTDDFMIVELTSTSIKVVRN